MINSGVIASVVIPGDNHLGNNTPEHSEGGCRCPTQYATSTHHASLRRRNDELLCWFLAPENVSESEREDGIIIVRRRGITATGSTCSFSRCGAILAFHFIAIVADSCTTCIYHAPAQWERATIGVSIYHVIRIRNRGQCNFSN